MLKITVEEIRNPRGRFVRLSLEGELAGPWVKELENTWDRLIQERPAAIKVDLRSLDFFSEAGERLLQRMKHQGNELVPGSLPMRARIAELRRVAPSIIAPLLALAFAGTTYGQTSNPERLGRDFGLSQEQNPQIIVMNSRVDGAPATAFCRYLASIQERNPFTESGAVAVEIEASIPGMGKQARLLAIRQTDASERTAYQILTVEGDSTAKRQIIARYLAAEQQAEIVPSSSVAITPANYRFRYAGSIKTGGNVAYVFQLNPKKKRTGLIQGQLWIDSTTGIAVRQMGVFVKRPSVFIRRAKVLRETNLDDGFPSVRTTHVSIETRLVGRAELTITERVLASADSEPAQRLITQ
jgi:hypothetical protein